MTPNHGYRNSNGRGAHAANGQDARARRNERRAREAERQRRQAEARRASRRAPLLIACCVLVAVVAAGAVWFATRGSAAGAETDATVDATSFEAATARAVATVAGNAADAVETAAPIYRQLGEATANIAADGAQVGYYLGTVDGRQIESYNADTTFYGASSIKGPFVIAELASGASLQAQLGNVTNAIENSDNSAYYSLRLAWGFDALNEWLTDVGVDMTTNTTSYAYYSTRQLANLWVKAWDYLKDAGDDQATVDEIFSAPLNSSFNTLGADKTWSKPGWISGELNATVDAGLVEYGGQTYVLAVMTSDGEDFDDVSSIVGALGKLAELDAEISG